MKRMLSLLLVFVMLLSLLSGCGGGDVQEPAKASPEATVPAEATEAPATEPALSPEEVLYNSLTERQKQRQSPQR